MRTTLSSRSRSDSTGRPLIREDGPRSIPERLIDVKGIESVRPRDRSSSRSKRDSRLPECRRPWTAQRIATVPLMRPS
jgi:hypothetical protein